MVSFHNVKSITLTEPREHSGGFTNELIINSDEKSFRFDLFSQDRHALRIADEQIRTLRTLFRDVLELEFANEINN
jgi:hypothetical protein